MSLSRPVLVIACENAVLYVDFAATGEITKVAPSTTDVTPPSIPACMTAAAQTLKLAPGRTAGNISGGYVPKVD